jgi:Peptidase family S41
MINSLSRRTLLGSGLAFFLVSRPGWATTPQVFEGAKIKGDIAILRRVLLALHPGLYRYASAAQVTARLEMLERDWSRDQSLSSAYLSLSHFLTTIKCGHSYANFYNQMDAFKSGIFESSARLPFWFRWIDGKMIVTKNQSLDARLVPGTVISAVNGIATRQILSMLIAYTRADGNNDAKRAALLEIRGEDEWETFDIFYGLLFPNPSGQFTLDALLPGGKRTQLMVRSITLAARRDGLSERLAAQQKGPAWTIRYTGKVATLTMPSWGLYNSSWDWQSFLDQSFADMAKRDTNALIVDLRGNEGGLDCGDAIIARMIDTPLSLDGGERRVRYRRVAADLMPYLDTWDPGFATLGEGASALEGGFFKLDQGANRVIIPKAPRFKGKLIVLTDAQNSSATFQFASVIKERRIGTLIGEPTGGNQRGINGGAFYFLRLPATGIEVDIPLIGYFPNLPKADAGIDPDIMIRPTLRDFTNSNDVVMSRAEAFASA